jgi:NAD(P)-dependent dehydrogenase (short-subunit alcohol dehydrogenase family)
VVSAGTDRDTTAVDDGCRFGSHRQCHVDRSGGAAPAAGYYAASKAALAQATRSLRLELVETPIRVLEVVPGSTDTALRDIDELPWKSAPPKTLPAVSPKSTAAAVVRELQRGSTRVVYPSYSLVPLDYPPSDAWWPRSVVAASTCGPRSIGLPDAG